MIKAYLYLNAFLYLALAVWCSAQHGQTSKASGFVELSPGGHSEYLVIYGGLQLGLAAFFAYCGHEAEYHRVGLILSLLLYVPIVGYRIATVLFFRPVGVITLGTGGLEALLLIGAGILFFSQRSGS